MRPGHPKIITEKISKRILEISNANPFKSATKIRAQYTSIQYVIDCVNVISMVKIPFISKKNKQQRRQFYEKHI